jgi:hypothetical protein
VHLILGPSRIYEVNARIVEAVQELSDPQHLLSNKQLRQGVVLGIGRVSLPNPLQQDLPRTAEDNWEEQNRGGSLYNVMEMPPLKCIAHGKVEDHGDPRCNEFLTDAEEQIVRDPICVDLTALDACGAPDRAPEGI